ncbi:MAG: class I SAM-dependent methyltransferase [Candidatus Cloacimonetes bacterium]|nr:class I SAM-dependent methyltransferase [Candidatus Cloacimonadota bacterium]
MKRLLKPVVRKAFGLKAGQVFREIIRQETGLARQIGLALQDVVTDNFSQEERTVIERIEQRRSALGRMDDEIAFVDFGAGQSTEHRTQMEMQNGVVSKRRISSIAAVSKPPFWASILFKLVRRLEPQTIVELGTCVGISAAYQASAQKLNQRGKLFSLEGAESLATISRETLGGLGISNSEVVLGPFHQTLMPVLEEHAPIDFFFNDGHHDHDAVLEYFEKSLPFLAGDAVMVFDDISWSDGMRQAWKEIVADPRIRFSLDLRSIGVVVISAERGTKTHYRAALV